MGGGGVHDILRKGGPLYAVLIHCIRCSVERGQVRMIACTFTQTTSQARVKGKGRGVEFTKKRPIGFLEEGGFYSVVERVCIILIRQ
jgi:hypothetical protein